MNHYYALFLILQCLNILKADIFKISPNNVKLLNSGEGYIFEYPPNCTVILDEFAQYASDLTKCSILHARPIRLCEACIDEYMNFHNKYEELLNTSVNGTSCKSKFISHDRLDAILEYHDNILSIWDKGHCSDCYDWTNPSAPVLLNETKHFYVLYNETMTCIQKYEEITKNDTEVCDKCMKNYLQLDNYYKTLSEDAIGVDSICMDIVDSMNATRSIWSKTLNCCKIRRTPEVIFLCCSGIISALPLLYYLVLRYFGPIRDFPNVLKQSRFKQSFMRSNNGRIN